MGSNRYFDFWKDFSGLFLLADEAGRVISCNGHFARTLGYAPEELIGKAKTSLFVQDEAFQTYFHQSAQLGVATATLTALHKQGDSLLCGISGSHFFDERGMMLHLLTGNWLHQPAAAPFTKADGAFRALMEVSPVAFILSDWSGRIIDFNNKAIEYLYFSSGYLLDGPSYVAENETRFINEGLEPLAPEDFPFEQVKAHQSTVNGFVIGVCRQHRVRWFLVNAQYIIQPNSEPMVIENWVDITERVQAKTALAKAREQLEETHEQARIGAWEDFPETEELRWSRMVHLICEVPEGYVPNLNDGIAFYKPGAHRDTIQAALAELMEKGTPYTTDLQMITARGNEVWVRATGRAEFREGKCYRIYGTFQDIDDSKRKEMALAAREAEISQIYDTISDVVFKLEVEGANRYRFVSINEAFLTATGLLREQVLNRLTAEVIPEPSLRLVHTNYAKAIATKQAVEWEETTPYNGTEKTGIVRVSPLFDAHGNCTHLIGNVHDVTELKQAALSVEASLNELNHQKFALDQHSIVAVTDLQGNLVYVNDKFCEISGYSRDELLGQNHRMINSGTHPRSFFQEMYQSIYAGKVWHGDICNKRKDGSLYWVRTTIVPFEDAHTKKLSQFIAIRTDITQERATMHALLRSEEYLRTIFDYSLTAIIVADDEGNYIDANKFACELFGCTRETFLQLNVKQLEVIDSKPTNELYAHYVNKGIDQGEFHFVNFAGKKVFTLYQAIRIRENFNVSILIDITDRVDIERKVYSTQQLLEEAFNTVSDVIYVLEVQADGRLKFLSINHAFTKYTGIDTAERIDKYVDEAVPSPLRELELMHYQQAIQTGKSVTFEESAVYPTGKHYTIVTCTPLIDANGQCYRLICSARDITDIIDSQNEIRRLSLIARETINAAIITDVAGRISWVNKAFEHITGYELAEIAGKKPGDFLQGKQTDPATIAYMRQQIALRQPFEVEVLNYHKSGSPYWIKIQCQPLLNAQGEHEGFFAIETDVTNEKEIKLERELLIRELTEHNNDLKQFTYITSHNLRAPLTNLMAIANLLELPEGTDAFTLELIEGFKNSTQRLNETLDDLIRILLIKESPHIDVEKVNFESILHKVMGSLNLLMNESKAQIDMDFSQVQEVVFSPAYMESIFLNLLSNAIKYRSPDRPLRIAIKAKKRGHMVVVTFSDNGLGFDLKRVKERVFGLYQRFHNNTDSKGVGLYLIKSQITALGGNIDVQSEEGEGTTFTMTFKA